MVFSITASSVARQIFCRGSLLTVTKSPGKRFAGLHTRNGGKGFVTTASIHKQRGFHLLEILVTLGLVSILSMIGVSSYSHYILRAARLEAGVSLSQLAIAFEKGYLANQRYGEVNMILPTNKHYRIITTYVNRNDYQLMAQPISSAAKKDACGALMLNAAGEKSVKGTADMKDCW